ncbi:MULTISPECIES: type IV pilus biogenesis protein PilP [Pseudomonas syringae group]|uniref:type IV pilus biogenesis protein PilP n=1 Tax=Pseudomonas syringae group TaxID=136849 RepID=UPI001E57FAAD|nr:MULTISPECIES: type IV pilus biogenesis protein PilP [Pseudomonas]MCD5972567.1 type IV pilus biogenesis protein PilP [Pseudomonas quasicaspiana]MDU8358492.1 type IV pilus biogenesis protein PilP [Pseudomonas syringae group sp. J309-1]
MCINTHASILLTFLLSCVAVGNMAVAADPSPTDLSRINIGVLSQVQTETLFFKAQAARARAMEEIVNGGKTSTSAPVQVMQSAYTMPAPASNSTPQLPVVKTVFRTNNTLHATLLYGSGFEVDASIGNAELPGGFKVISVSLDSVVLSHGGRRYPLGFSTRAPSASVDAPQMSLQTLKPITPGQPSAMDPMSSVSQEFQQ